MSESNLPPEHWRPLFDAIGVEFGYRPLANRIGMDHTRLRRLLLGGGTSAATVQKVASAFGVSPADVLELRGEGRGAAVEPFTLPDDAGRLNEKERDVVRAMVRVLLDSKDATDEQPVHSADDPSPAQPGAQSAEDQKTNNAPDLTEGSQAGGVDGGSVNQAKGREALRGLGREADRLRRTDKNKKLGRGQ